MKCNKNPITFFFSPPWDFARPLVSPDLQVHDDLPLVHILRVHLDPVDPEGLHDKTHTETR